MDRLHMLKMLIGRDEAVASRLERELAELTGWYVEDGDPPYLARRKALVAHPYLTLKKWRTT